MCPLISIIVPVYNKIEYIRACLNSIIRQTYTNLEIILVNDGSTDGSAEICDEYTENNKVNVYHKINGGSVVLEILVLASRMENIFVL